MDYLKRVSYQSLQHLPDTNIKIRTAWRGLIKIPSTRPITPQGILINRVLVKKTKSGIQLEIPKAMNGESLGEWKEEHRELLSQIREMTRSEWIKYLEQYEKA